MAAPDQQLLYFSTLLQLERQIRCAKDLAELSYMAVNDTIRLLPYRQALLWRRDFRGRPVIKSVSGVDQADPNAPAIRYINRLLKWLQANCPLQEAKIISVNDVPEHFQEDWEEFSVGYLVWSPLTTPAGRPIGGIIYLRETPWQDAEIALLQRLSEAYAHAMAALIGPPRKLPAMLVSKPFKRMIQLLLLVGVVFAMDQPVHLSVLAPAEIVPRQPVIVSPAIDGVIKSFAVEPNQHVEKDQLLFSLDDTNIRNEYEVAQKSLAVVEAELSRLRQKAFADPESRAQILHLESMRSQKLAESEYLLDMRAKTRIHADQSGITIFTDVNDWLGRPVRIGEKVMTLAQAEAVEAEILLPVADAISLEPEADVLIFLNIDPESPLTGKIRQASYAASVTDEGILAYQLKVSLQPEAQSLPRLGMRGTAKLYGDEVKLVYFLFRRPYLWLRQNLGV